MSDSQLGSLAAQQHALGQVSPPCTTPTVRSLVIQCIKNASSAQLKLGNLLGAVSKRPDPNLATEGTEEDSLMKDLGHLVALTSQLEFLSAELGVSIGVECP